MEDLAGKLTALLQDEESLKQIQELAEMMGLSSPSESPPLPQQVGEIPDMEQIMGLVNLLQEAKPDDENICFLNALRPLLGEERRPRVDKAVKLLRLLNMLPAIKESGILGGDLFGIF